MRYSSPGTKVFYFWWCVVFAFCFYEKGFENGIYLIGKMIGIYFFVCLPHLICIFSEHSKEIDKYKKEIEQYKKEIERLKKGA